MSIRIRSAARSAVTATLAAALAATLAAGLTAAPAVASTLSGRVVDADGHPVANAQVTVIEVGRSTLTDDDGRYVLRDLPPGAYRVALQRLGFAPEVRAVTVGPEDHRLDLALRVSLVEIPAVQVTASAHATTALSSPQPVSVLDGEALRAARGATLGATVGGLPGVRSWSTGGGIGKPVIRGLRSDRVLVLADGARLESQQWGDEHGPNVDVEDVERIEVIRGPASVLYGSDALGGVVNVIPYEMPTAFDRPAFALGRLAGAFESNGDATRGHLGVEGASGGLGWRAALTGRRARDVETPDGALHNSGGGDAAGAAEVGWRGRWGTLQVAWARRHERIEIHEDPAEDPEATPYQRIEDDRVRLKGVLPVGGGAHLDVLGTWQANRRNEFEEERSDELALGLRAATAAGDVRYHHAHLGSLSGLFGVSFQRQRFTGTGEERLIPDARHWNVAAYVFEQAESGPWNLSLGARFDHRALEVADAPTLAVAADRRSWNAVTGTAGLLRRFGPTLALALNAGRGFRAPSVFDLYSNGVHEGTVAFEVGDPGLDTETSLNLDLALRVQATRLRAEVTAYWNRIADFIHTRPTGAIDPGSGYQVFEVVQGDARFLGAEAQVEFHPTGALHLQAGADYVAGQNTTSGTPLPWVPPFRATWGVRLEGDPLGALTGPYVELSGESHARQRRLDPFDVAPAGFTLLHAGVGAGVVTGGRTLRVALTCRNLLDTAYADFLSRYKTYALDPGRNVVLRLASEF